MLPYCLLGLPDVFLVTKCLSLLLSAYLCQSLKVQKITFFSPCLSKLQSMCNIAHSFCSNFLLHTHFITKLRSHLNQKLLSTEY